MPFWDFRDYCDDEVIIHLVLPLLSGFHGEMPQETTGCLVPSSAMTGDRSLGAISWGLCDFRNYCEGSQSLESPSGSYSWLPAAVAIALWLHG